MSDEWEKHRQTLEDRLAEADRKRLAFTDKVTSRFLATATSVPNSQQPEAVVVIGQPGSKAQSKALYLHNELDRAATTGTAYISLDAITRLHPEHRHLDAFEATLDEFYNTRWGWTNNEYLEYRAARQEVYEDVHGVQLTNIQSDIYAAYHTLLREVRDRRMHAVVHLAPRILADAHVIGDFKGGRVLEVAYESGFWQEDVGTHRVEAHFHAVAQRVSLLEFYAELGHTDPVSFERVLFHNEVHGTVRKVAHMIDQSDRLVNDVRVYDAHNRLRYANQFDETTGQWTTTPATAACIDREETRGLGHDEAVARARAVRRLLDPAHQRRLERNLERAPWLFPIADAPAERIAEKDGTARPV